MTQSSVAQETVYVVYHTGWDLVVRLLITAVPFVIAFGAVFFRTSRKGAGAGYTTTFVAGLVFALLFGSMYASSLNLPDNQRMLVLRYFLQNLAELALALGVIAAFAIWLGIRAYRKRNAANVPKEFD